MVMSSFLMNSSPAAYASADPKFPPTEEYSQGNYIPDYYGASAQPTTNVPTTHQSHYGYHHHPALNYIDQSQQQYHHHHHNHHVGPPQGPPQYYNPCAGGGLGATSGPPPHATLHHSIASSHQISPHQSLTPQLSHLSRVSSPGLHRSPSPRTQAALSIVEPPSPPDCGISGQSGSDSGTGNGGGGHPVIYPWMKKVHVNQGKCKGKHMLCYIVVFSWV